MTAAERPRVASAAGRLAGSSRPVAWRKTAALVPNAVVTAAPRARTVAASGLVSLPGHPVTSSVPSSWRRTSFGHGRVKNPAVRAGSIASETGGQPLESRVQSGWQSSSAPAAEPPGHVAEPRSGPSHSSNPSRTSSPHSGMPSHSQSGLQNPHSPDTKPPPGDPESHASPGSVVPLPHTAGGASRVSVKEPESKLEKPSTTTKYVVP